MDTSRIFRVHAPGRPRRLQGSTVVLLLFWAMGLAAQERSLPVDMGEPAGPAEAPSRVLQLADEAALDVLRTALDGDPAEARLDDAYLLVRWKSALALPLVEERLRAALPEEGSGGARVQIQLDLVAYAADSGTAGVLGRLAARSPEPAAEALAAALDYAWGRSTAFPLAYDVLAQGSPPLTAAAVRWVRALVAGGNGLEEWAAFLRARHGGEGAAPAAADPLLRAVFGEQVPPVLRRALEPDIPR